MLPIDDNFSQKCFLALIVFSVKKKEESILDDFCLDTERIFDRAFCDLFARSLHNFSKDLLLKYDFGSNRLKIVELNLFDTFRKVKNIFQDLPLKLLLLPRNWKKLCNEFDKIFDNFKLRILGKLL